MINPTIIANARMDALNGEMAWRAPLTSAPALSDIICHGYAVVMLDGDRAPRRSKCVGCGKLSSLAWFIAPLGVTKCGCTCECVAGKIERLWADTLTVRVIGDAAVRLLTGGAA